LVHGGWVLAAGISHGGDSAGYSQAADRLIAYGYGPAIAATDTTYPVSLYLLFATLVAGLKLVLGRFWELGLVGINIGAAALVAALLVRLVWRSTGSCVATWAALGLYLACFDILRWTPFLLSDSSFLLLAFAVFALAADRILTRKGSWLPVFALAAAACFYRPTGVVLFPCAAWALFLARSRPGATRKAAAAMLAVTAAAGAFLFAWVVQQPSRWPLPTLARTVEDTAHAYAAGEVVSARPETWHAPPVSLADNVRIAGDRFVHFFAVRAEDFSLAHAAVNAIFYLPAYAMALWFAAQLARGRDELEQSQRDVFLAAGAFVLATAAFHGLLQVDYDWRYRLPVLPHIILLAAGGVALLVRRRAER
jgi:hypothetical protein